MLSDSRATKINYDLKQTKAETGYDTAADELDIFKNRPKWLLLDSHWALLEEIFWELDKYSDYILIRHDFIHYLREDDRIKVFIDRPAVQLPKARKQITFSEILKEIEQEQKICEEDKVASLNQQLWDKTYITFREFINYFKDYKSPEQRHREEKYEFNKDVYLSEPIPKIEESDDNQDVLDNTHRLREEDQIDADVEHLNLINDIYDSLPRVHGIDEVNKDEFFLTWRKDPQIRRILTTIAREPDGKSRIHRETYQEVFDRMEKWENLKTLAWSTIIEYFTKRGRPLTKEEKAQLIQQDKDHDEFLKK